MLLINYPATGIVLLHFMEIRMNKAEKKCFKWLYVNLLIQVTTASEESYLLLLALKVSDTEHKGETIKVEQF